MGQLFSVSFASTSVANASGDFDLWEFDAAADHPIEILSIELGLTSSGDWTEEEQLDISIVRGNTTSGNGTAAAEVPLPFPGPTASFAAETVASTPASAGTAVVLWGNTWNVRAPGPIFPPAPQGAGYGTNDSGGLLCVRLNTAVADDVTLKGTAIVYEY